MQSPSTVSPTLGIPQSATSPGAPFDSSAFCAEKGRCPYFGAVFGDDARTRRALVAAFDATGLDIPKWVFAGIESSVTRVRTGSKVMVLGEACQPHFCKGNHLAVLLDRSPLRIAGLLQSGHTRTFIGSPTTSERQFLVDAITEGSAVYGALRSADPVVLDLPLPSSATSDRNGPPAEPSRKAQQAEVNTLLTWAAQNGDQLQVRMMLAWGANVNHFEGHATALMGASFREHEPIVLQLLDAGANVHLKNVAGTTALIYAAMAGHSRVLVTLLQRGARVNETDRLEQTALLHAATVGSLESVRALLSAGSSVKFRNARGVSPLHAARELAKNAAIVDLLVRAGARD